MKDEDGKCGIKARGTQHARLACSLLHALVSKHLPPAFTADMHCLDMYQTEQTMSFVYQCGEQRSYAKIKSFRAEKFPLNFHHCTS